MSRTVNLKRQHDAALEIVGEIVHGSERIAELDEAYRLSVKLAKLTGLLRIHFVQEDRTLYPYMIASTNAAASETARAFSDEMGDLAPVYEAFAERWTSSAAIFGDPAGFRRESASVFKALGDRIERENNELYPLADAVQPHELRRTA